MLDVLRTRLSQKHRTMRYPDGPPPELPERFAGRPVVGRRLRSRAAAGAPRSARPTPCARPPKACASTWAAACSAAPASPPARAAPSPSPATTAWPPRRREDLIVGPGDPAPRGRAGTRSPRGCFGRSLKLRQVSAGGCNACEADTNVLGTVAWDLGRFGIQFVASPRHADGLLVTGPVTENMRLALREDLRRRADPEGRDRRGGLRHLRRPLRRAPRAVGRRGRGRARGPLHPGLPAPPPHDPGRAAAVPRSNPG